MKIAHILNPFKSNDYNNKITDITLESIKNAIEYKKYGDLNVEACYTCYEEDLPIMEKYKDFKQLSLLNRSILDIKEFKIPKKLPFVFDILNKYKEIDADYYIYTNIDIHLVKNFYNKIYEYIKSGFEDMTINRVTIFTDDLNNINIEDLYSLVDIGEYHPGIDCFVFKKETLEKIPNVDFCIGTAYFDKYLYNSLHKYSNKSVHLLKPKLTFHIGDDREWINDIFSDYREYNKDLFNKYGFIYYQIYIIADYYNKDDDYTFFIKYHYSLSNGIDKEIIKYFKKHKIYYGNFLEIGYSINSRSKLLSECGWGGYVIESSFDEFQSAIKDLNNKNIKFFNTDVSEKRTMCIENKDYKYNISTITVDELFDEIDTNFELILLNKKDNSEIIKKLPNDVFYKCHIFAIEFTNNDDFYITKMFLGTYGYIIIEKIDNCVLFSKY